MNIFVYGDESGVFDNAHHDYFVFAGLIFLDKEEKDLNNRKFLSAERAIMPRYGKSELKACRLKPKHKAGLFRSTNRCIRYAAVINQQKVNENIFNHKKSKQRYLDYVYKVGLKRAFQQLIKSGIMDPSSVENIYIRFDEHTTATDGRYELKEAIEEEFKHGTFNRSWSVFHEPIFPSMGTVELTFKDSRNDALIRASDIIAIQVLYLIKSGKTEAAKAKVILTQFP